MSPREWGGTVAPARSPLDPRIESGAGAEPHTKDGIMEASKTIETETIETETIAELATLALAAAAAQAEQDAAHAARLDGEAQVLLHILALAKPALRAICGPVRHAVDWCEDPTGGYPSDGEGTAHYRWRGICLDGPPDSVGPTRTRTDDTHGTHTGEDLLLDTSGLVWLVSYTGRWSQWQGESSGWTSEARTLTAREAVERIDPECALRQITAALRRACDGNAAARTQKNLARVARMDAILALLGVGK